MTNSSSSSFCVAITVNGKDGSSHTLMIDPAEESELYDLEKKTVQTTVTITV